MTKNKASVTNYGKNKIRAEKLSIDQKKHKFKSEVFFKRLLDYFDISYVWQKPYYSSTHFYVVDFYLPYFNVVIEIDGGSHSKTKNYDKRRDHYLKNKFKIRGIIRIKNNELSKITKNTLLNLITDQIHNIDYKLLLKKYMSHIYDIEGVFYLDIANHVVDGDFTNKEMTELKKISKTIEPK